LLYFRIGVIAEPCNSTQVTSSCTSPTCPARGVATVLVRRGGRPQPTGTVTIDVGSFKQATNKALGMLK